MKALKIVASIATAVLFVLYPIAIWIALVEFSPRAVGLIALALLVPIFLVRFRRAERADMLAVIRVPLVIVAVLGCGVVFDDARFVLAMPVLINLALLATFGASLFAEHTIVERFARMQEKTALSAAQVRHCRQTTWAWCGFFVLNATIAALLALTAPLAWWAAYTSGIAYALMGLMFAGEYVVRQYRFRKYGRGLHDRVLSRIFPPPSEADR